MRLITLLVCLLFPAAVSAANPVFTARTMTLTGYDEFIFLGWNNACSVGLQYLSYPPVGHAMRGFPDRWNIGTLTIDPGEIDVETRWTEKGEDPLHWDPARANKATEEILRMGYGPAGHSETIRQARVADKQGLSRIIHSTTTFRLGYPTSWPPKQFVLSKVHYSSLSNCALMLFRNLKNPRDSYRFKLIRILNPGVRRRRARAHVTNGLFLYKEESDIYASEEEMRIAADMDPEYPLALYYHASLLALHGHFDESLARLKEAVTRKPAYAKKAHSAIEFESLWNDRRFIAIVGPKSPFP